MSSDPGTKSSAQIWTDFLKHIVGLDKGYVFTLKAIYTQPEDVVSSYFNNRSKYLSPFALLGISFTVYYLISGLLVDWTAVAQVLKDLYRRLLEWQVQLSPGSPEKDAQLVEQVYNGMLVPVIDVMVAAVSKYAIVIVLPFEVIMLYCLSLFTRKHGLGFYHHFISLNYFLSFSILCLNVIIVIGLINPWLMIPGALIYNYFFYGKWFKSYGEKTQVVRTAAMKGFPLGLLIAVVLSVVVGIVWGAVLGSTSS